MINSVAEPFMLQDVSMRRTTIRRSMEQVLKKKLSIGLCISPRLHPQKRRMLFQIIRVQLKLQHTLKST